MLISWEPDFKEVNKLDNRTKGRVYRDKDHKAFSLAHWNENQPVKEVNGLDAIKTRIKNRVIELKNEIKCSSTGSWSSFFDDKSNRARLAEAKYILEIIEGVNSGH